VRRRAFVNFQSPLRVLMVASEVAPYAKTGGLADVIGSLPAALTARGLDVRVVLPRYDSISSGQFPARVVGHIEIAFDGATQTAQLLQVDAAQTPVATYFIDAPQYFCRRRLYGESDDVLRFGFFSRVAVELPRVLGWHSHIIHCHDWHSGLVPAYCRSSPNSWRVEDDTRCRAKTVFTIHNLAYQGLAHKDFLPRLGLDWSLFNTQGLEFYDQINPMKAALVWSDAVTTVSPQYAREVQTPEFGAGLDGVLRTRSAAISGILNGIDYNKWNPGTDCVIAANYSSEDMRGKAACRRDLLHHLRLPNDSTKPIIGMVSRLSSQKGFDLVAQAMEPMLKMGFQFVLLGTGDQRYERAFEDLARRFPQSVVAKLGVFNDDLAHRIYAGSDFFLMPSRYEPCGLGQMIALAYGTIPIVRATGGLVDSVREFDPAQGQGNGFTFAEFSAEAMLHALHRARCCFHSPQWPRLLQNALECDFSWDLSAAQYESLYRRVLGMSRSNTQLALEA
jgi:starch synthase